ncbi:MAG TPA: phosphodiester glycosidase family protein [Bacteroidota bacterium]|nr:phosphodiester glycosidase family protein [Bacteroidota bacterium]
MRTRTLSLLVSLACLLFIVCSEGRTATASPNSPPIGADTVVAGIDTSLHIQTVLEGGLTIYRIDRYNTIVVKIPRISSYMYFPHPTRSLAEVGNDSGYALVVNASYFDNTIEYGDHDTTVTFRNAGYLKLGDSVYQQMKSDRQLTCLFAYDSRKNIVDYLGVNDLALTKDFDLVVQIGPQIIRKNEIDTTDIDASVNGDTQWERTAFASVNGKEFYIVVNLASSRVTLRDLGTLLKASGIFKKDLDAVNFDGGRSTSLYIRHHPEFSTKSGNRMPFLIGVR